MKITMKLAAIAIVALLACSCTKSGDQIKCSDVTKKTTIVSADPDHYRHWMWEGPNQKHTDEELAVRYKKYYDAGIVGIYFEGDSERHFRAAKAQGLQAHRWMWIMNRGDIVEKHPEWAAISRSGKSTAEFPPYVGYYRWVCPNKSEVQQYLVDQVKETLAKDYIDGIHMDYVRYSDVVLAVNLWKGYGIVQTEELPEYDFCYCDDCKAAFKKKHNQDVDAMEYPQESLSWRSFRYNSVTNIVNQLVKTANSMDKPITAAVFPTPDVAKNLVLQDWTRWDLDAVYPMIYHGFYKESLQWIGDAVEQGTHEIGGRYPLYAGIYIPDFKDSKEIEEGVKYALENGADGISIFGSVSDDVLDILSRHRDRK